MEEYLVPDSSVREYYHYYSIMGAIAYVSEHDVAQTWRLLKPLLPADMDSFSSYYERSWIGTSSQLHAQLHALLLQPHSRKVPRLSISGAVPHRRKTHEYTPPRAP